MIIDKDDLRLLKATEQKNARPVLTGLALNGNQVVAVDGYVCVVRTHNETDAIDGQAIIPAPLFSLFKVGNKDTIEITRTDGGKLKAKLHNNCFFADASIDFNPIQGTYPKYTQLFESTDKKASITVDVKKLRQVLSVLPETGCVDIGIISPIKPLEFSMKHEDTTTHALLMPIMRNSEHGWYRQVITEKEPVSAKA